MWTRAALWAVLFVGASAMAVTVQLVTYGGLTGEIVEIESTLSIAPGGVAVNVLGLSAAGTTQGTAIEIALLLATATPGVSAGNYAYSATVNEASVGAVTSGTYRAELFVDDVSKGQVFFTQGVSELLNVEGVALVWDVGASVGTGAVSYEVTAIKL